MNGSDPMDPPEKKATWPPNKNAGFKGNGQSHGLTSN